jgi:hypothetical protein
MTSSSNNYNASYTPYQYQQDCATTNSHFVNTTGSSSDDCAVDLGTIEVLPQNRSIHSSTIHPFDNNYRYLERSYDDRYMERTYTNSFVERNTNPSSYHYIHDQIHPGGDQQNRNGVSFSFESNPNTTTQERSEFWDHHTDGNQSLSLHYGHPNYTSNQPSTRGEQVFLGNDQLSTANYPIYGNDPFSSNNVQLDGYYSAMRTKSNSKPSRRLIISDPVRSGGHDESNEIEYETVPLKPSSLWVAEDFASRPSGQNSARETPVCELKNAMESPISLVDDVCEVSVDFNNCINKILDRISTVECHSSTSILTPLHPNELANLSYLCTSALQEQKHDGNLLFQATPSKKRSRGKTDKATKTTSLSPTKRKRQMILLENLDLEAVVSLVELLEKHIRAAMNIQIMENAVQTLQLGGISEKNKTTNRRKSGTSKSDNQNFDQVRINVL